MIAEGTIVNTAAVILGGVAGLLAQKGIPEKLQDTLMKASGIAVIFIGISGAMTGMLKVEDGVLQTSGTMLMIASLVIGSILGEWIGIEAGMESIGERLKQKFHMQGDNRFVEAFVTNTLIICVGAMAVVGALQDGFGDPSMLYAKAVLDALITMVFAATLGPGAVFAAIPIFVYQGSITLLATLIASYLNDAFIANLSYIGSILIMGVGINLTWGKMIRIGNMLPALLVAAGYSLFFM